MPDNKITSDHNFKLDSNSFDKLFNELYPELCRFSIQFVCIPEIAEEIVQDQFVYIWERRHTIQIRDSYKSYLFKAVKNKSINYLKSRFAKTNFVKEELSYDLSEQTNPLKLIEDKEQTTLVTKALEYLPERCHVIFSMSRFGELSNKQIANELNISEKTVENQITIAIKKLKTLLGEFLVVLYFIALI